jgi:hypothetical protein
MYTNPMHAQKFSQAIADAIKPQETNPASMNLHRFSGQQIQAAYTSLLSELT